MSNMQNIKLVVIGDGTVGKTSLLVSYANNEFPQEHVPTVFDNYSKNIMVDHTPIFLNLWDTAGQEEFDRMRSLSYQDVDVFLLCYSCANEESYENIRTKWSLEAQHFSPLTPMILVATKCDLRQDQEFVEAHQKKGRTIKSSEDGRKLKDEIGAKLFLECSAKTQDGLQHLFEESVRTVLKSRKSSNCCTIL